jgi:hypothetical protein
MNTNDKAEGYYNHVREELIAYIPPLSGHRVLDVGVFLTCFSSFDPSLKRLIFLIKNSCPLFLKKIGSGDGSGQ